MKKPLNLFAVLAFPILLTACAAISGRETAGEYIDDTAITARIKTAILNEPTLRVSQIHVETFQGDVQLSGFVDSMQEAAKAEALSLKMSGVKSVKNTLVVRKAKRSLKLRS